jgi:hypothetical protein
MRRHWRDLAERAAKAAFSAEEVCEALKPALKRDFIAEAPLDAVKDILGAGKQASLFSDDRAEQLEALRPASPSAIGNIVINCALEAVAEGLSGSAAVESTLRNALEEHTRGSFRSMEEHYQREANARSARFVRERLDAARNQSDFLALARDLSGVKQKVSEQRIPKRTGVDEGPQI